MEELIMYKEGEQSWVRWIKKRIKHNLNFLGIITGPTGSGKTYAGLSIANMIDPEFKIDYCVFDFREFMNLINNESFRKKKWKVIIFDEPQISMSNRDWQSKTNKLINYVLSTFRHQNIIVMFCCPYSDFLDAQSMKLIHAEFSCEGVNKQTNLSRLRPKIRQYNPNMKKTYFHALRVIRGKSVIPLRDWFVPKPNDELIKDYEEKKTAFTSQLNKEILMDLDMYAGDKKGIIATAQRKKLTERQEVVMKAWAEYDDANKVAEVTGIRLSNVYTFKKGAEAKGYTIEDFKAKKEHI